MHLRFEEVEPLSGAGLRLDAMSFYYDGTNPADGIFRNVDISANADSRVVIVSARKDLLKNY